MKAKAVSGYLVTMAGVIILLLVQTLFSAVIFRVIMMCMRLSVDPGAIWIGSCVLVGCTFIMLTGFYAIGATKDGE